jgi:GR25 family glycosyltransferase involved in LPS biosynthesis
MFICKIILPSEEIKMNGRITITDILKTPEQINMEDVNDEVIQVNDKWHRKEYGFSLSEMEIQNIRAHRKAWKKFLKDGSAWGLILENNVTINLSEQDLNDTIKTFSPGWDLFFPYDPARPYKGRGERVKQQADSLLNPNVRERYEMEPYRLGYKWGNSIYFISKKGAEKLLEIRTVKQRLDDEIVERALAGSLETHFGTVPWLDYDKQMDDADFSDRQKAIREAIFKNGSWTPLRKKRVRHILHTMSTAAKHQRTDLILQGGTHLGYIRHGGIMPWDDDVDIGIEEKDLRPFLREINRWKHFRWGEFIEPRTHVPYYKIWHDEGEEITGHEYTFPFVDLWVFNKKGRDLVFKNGIVCPNSALKSFEEVIFEGELFKIPFNSIECLDTRYTDWKSRIRVYVWCHRLEQPEFQPLTLEIEVDETGAMRL